VKIGIKMSSSFKIIGTVSKAETLAELLQSPERLKDCDMVELRFDEFMQAELCLELCKKLRHFTQVLLTIRTDREGGSWAIDDKERLDLFKFFAKDVDYIDIELKSELFKNTSKTEFPDSLKIIASYHDYNSTPDNETIQAFIDSGKKWGVNIVKLAVTPNNTEDLARLESFLSQSKICLIGMGELGVVTRREYPLKGSLLTYGYLDNCAAPGQISAAELKQYLQTKSS
jgi:3-dehydroquinate dehydratase I